MKTTISKVVRYYFTELNEKYGHFQLILECGHYQLVDARPGDPTPSSARCSVCSSSYVKKTHLSNVTELPLCGAWAGNAKRSTNPSEVTCKHCLRIMETDSFANDQVRAEDVREQTKCNPLASPLAIDLLPTLEQLAHPNCPTERWWKLAAFHPEEAQVSPLFPLLTLETPERWTGMAETLVNRQIVALWDVLPIPVKRRLSTEFNARPPIHPGPSIAVQGTTTAERAAHWAARGAACLAEAHWKLARVQACAKGES